MKVRIQKNSFNAGQEINNFSANQKNIGAITTFTGIVRNNSAESLKVMEIEHYPGMAEKAIHEIVDTAIARWSLADVLVIHRFGALVPGDVIMMVATAASHRKDAFEAAEYLMDYLKSRAPFWKKEITQETANWVLSKETDENSLSRW